MNARLVACSFIHPPTSLSPSFRQCNAEFMKNWYMAVLDLIGELDHVDHHLYPRYVRPPFSSKSRILPSIHQTHHPRIYSRTSLSPPHPPTHLLTHVVPFPYTARRSATPTWGSTSFTGCFWCPARSWASFGTCGATSRGESASRISGWVSGWVGGCIVG